MQPTGAPALQVPPAQVSTVVHALPSSQVVPSGLAGLEQTPVAGLHLPASWHWSGGAHRTGVPGAHVPLSQASPVVHASPSSHEVPFALAGFEHVPVAGLQVPASWHWSSAVQTTGLAPVHAPAWQVSLRVQASTSSQVVPSGLAGLEQAPVAGLHLPASWHWSGGAHTTGVPGAHVPPSQASLIVHASPSSHALPFGLGGFEHLPVAGSQVPASWHWSCAVQTTGFAPVQVPAWQVSLRVHALSSSQPAVFDAWTQPVTAVQESSVHGLPSSQFGGGPPTHLPPAHVSPVVQAFPSSHRAAFGLFTQPVVGLQTSSVQAFPSSQLGASPPTHRPPVQVSAVVHAFPSSQGAVFGLLTQSLAGSQESSVHGLPSSQLRAAPVQTPSEHMSPVVQAFPSSQGAVFGVLTQPVAGSQESSVHGLPSSQLSGAPAQTPSEHMSPVVQAFPSSHMVPEGKAVPATQVPDDRSQLSTPVQASPSSHSASLLQP